MHLAAGEGSGAVRPQCWARAEGVSSSWHNGAPSGRNRPRRRTHLARSLNGGSQAGAFGEDEEYLGEERPTNFELSQRPDKQKPTVRVRLSVHYRVHSRQILCIGGSQIPLGWSFLSIAKVPMTWNSGDVWTCQVCVCVPQC